VITDLAKNRSCVAAATIVLRSVDVNPTRNCDVRPSGTAVIREAGIAHPLVAMAMGPVQTAIRAVPSPLELTTLSSFRLDKYVEFAVGNREFRFAAIDAHHESRKYHGRSFVHIF
jgi:hypothetical protein